MNRFALIGIVLTGASLAPTTSLAQVSCSRDGLQRASISTSLPRPRAIRPAAAGDGSRVHGERGAADIDQG
jgi:hypothetical protein